MQPPSYECDKCGSSMGLNLLRLFDLLLCFVLKSDSFYFRQGLSVLILYITNGNRLYIRSLKGFIKLN